MAGVLISSTQCRPNKNRIVYTIDGAGPHVAVVADTVDAATFVTDRAVYLASRPVPTYPTDEEILKQAIIDAPREDAKKFMSITDAELDALLAKETGGK